MKIEIDSRFFKIRDYKLLKLTTSSINVKFEMFLRIHF